MKILSVFVLVLTCGLVPCQADTTPTQTWNVVAMCDPTLNPIAPFCGLPAKIEAVFTTQLRTGEFFDPEDTDFFEGTNAVVTNITGTFDGLPITFSPPAEGETLTGWLADNGFPEGVGFAAGGIRFDLSFEDGNIFLSCFSTMPCGITPIGTLFPMETMDWSAVQNVPESSLILDASHWIVVIGTIALGADELAEIGEELGAAGARPAWAAFSQYTKHSSRNKLFQVLDRHNRPVALALPLPRSRQSPIAASSA